MIKDDYSYFRNDYFFAAKSVTVSCLWDFFKKSEQHTIGGIKNFRTDNTLGFVNQKDTKQLIEFGIIHERTVRYLLARTKWRNRKVKLSCIDSLEHKFWAEGVNLTVFTPICTGASSIPDMTPFKIWFNKRANIENLHISGEEVFIHIPGAKNKNLILKAKKYHF